MEDPGGRTISATVRPPDGGGADGEQQQQQLQWRQRQPRQQQQPAQLSGRAICAYEATAAEGGGGGGGEGTTRQLKEMSFLQDLADTEAEERDRSFKASTRVAFPAGRGPARMPER